MSQTKPKGGRGQGDKMENALEAIRRENPECECGEKYMEERK
jgi:hypothetical protein